MIKKWPIKNHKRNEFYTWIDKVIDANEFLGSIEDEDALNEYLHQEYVRVYAAICEAEKERKNEIVSTAASATSKEYVN